MTTPPLVFAAANAAAIRTWGRGLSFDRQASHINVMPPPASAPSYALICSGYNQVQLAWICSSNHVPVGAEKLTSFTRTLIFVHNMGARAVVVFPAQVLHSAWWSQLGGPGVIQSFSVGGLRVVVVDHRD